MSKINLKVGDWQSSGIQVFWGEIAPCDHVVQIYEDDRSFLDTLEGFIITGIRAGDSVVIIATRMHLEMINTRLIHQGFDLESLKSNDQYIPLHADEVLSRFMIGKWPDEKLFIECITKVIDRAGRNGRKVRAFGEMVAVLWGQGLNGATVQLEGLWQGLHAKGRFTLYCAYPKAGFTQSAADSLNEICRQHSKVIGGGVGPSTEIYHRPP